MDRNWNEVMKKIAYRDARKDALDLERKEKQKDRNEYDDNSFLTTMIPVTPLLSIKTRGLDFHDVEKTLNRVRRYSIAEMKKSNKD